MSESGSKIPPMSDAFFKIFSEDPFKPVQVRVLNEMMLKEDHDITAEFDQDHDAQACRFCLNESKMKEERMMMKRTCRDAGYWQDLKTDVRFPTSWLDFVNQILRRVRVVLIKDVQEGRTSKWRLGSWVAMCAAAHREKKCSCMFG